MITRYVNTASSAGGDGTTNATSGANRAYVSLRAALDAIGSSLSDAMTIYCDGAGGADTSDCDQGAWDFTTTPTNYLLITTQGGARHTGKWTSGAYRLESTNRNAIYNNLACHLRIDGIQVQVTVSNGDQYIGIKTSNANQTVSTIDCRVSNCIVRAVMTSGSVLGLHARPPGGGGAGTATFHNCLVYDCYEGVNTDWSSVTFYNCTCVANEFNFDDSSVGARAINCLSGAAGTAGFITAFSGGSSNNASADDSAPGMNPRHNQTFTFVDAGSDDYHLSTSDSGARGWGLALPGGTLFADDIDGVTRAGAWDIGADQQGNSNGDIAVIGASASAANNPTSGNFPLPGNWQAGDFAVCWWYGRVSTKTWTDNSGGKLTVVYDDDQTNGVIAIATRYLQGGDVAGDLAWTSASVANASVAYGTLILRGMAASAAIEADSGTPGSFTNTQSPNPPSAVVSSPGGRLVITVFGKNNDYAGSITPPSGYGLGGHAQDTAGTDGSGGLAYKWNVAASTEDPGAWSLGGASTDDGRYWTASIKPAASGVSGSLTATLGALTVSAAATVDIAGASAPTLAALTASASGAVTVLGAAAPTLAALTSSAAGAVAVTGEAAPALAALTASAAGALAVSGTTSATLAALTGSAAGVVAVVGDATPTLGALTASATGTVAVAGAASPTLAALTSAATGTVDLTGASAVTLGALTVAAEGAVGSTPIEGALSSTLDAVSSTAAGAVAIAGDATPSLGALTVSAAGTVDVAGAAAPTLGALTTVAAGTVALAGEGTVTLAALAVAAEGVIGSVPIEGTLSATLGAVSAAAAGTVAVTGSAAPTLASLTSSATGGVAVSGASSSTLDALTATAAGAVQVSGASTPALAALTVSAAGTVGFVPIQGEVAATLAPLASSAAGAVTINGVVARTLDAATLAAMMAVAVSGQGGATLAGLSITALGIVTNVPPTVETLEIELVGQADQARPEFYGVSGAAEFYGPTQPTFYGRR